MENDNRNAYSEVIEILKLIDDEKKLEALPIEMLEVLKSKANPEYKPQISSEIPLDEQNLQPETFSILSWIAMKYWGDEIENESKEEEKEEETNEREREIEKENNRETREGLQNDEIKNQEEYEHKIENSEEKEFTIEQTSSNLPILHKDLKWYQRIKVKIIEFFHRIFKKDQNEKVKNDK